MISTLRFIFTAPSVLWLLALLPVLALLRWMLFQQRDRVVPSLIPYRDLLKDGPLKPPKRPLTDPILWLEIATLAAIIIGLAGPATIHSSPDAFRVLIIVDNSAASRCFDETIPGKPRMAAIRRAAARAASAVQDTRSNTTIRFVSLAGQTVFRDVADIVPDTGRFPLDALRAFSAGLAAFDNHAPDRTIFVTSRTPKQLGVTDDGKYGNVTWFRVGRSVDNTALIDVSFHPWTPGVLPDSAPAFFVRTARFSSRLRGNNPNATIHTAAKKTLLTLREAAKSFPLTPSEKNGLNADIIPYASLTFSTPVSTLSFKLTPPDACPDDDTFELPATDVFPTCRGRPLALPFTVTVEPGAGELIRLAVESLGVPVKSPSSDPTRPSVDWIRISGVRPADNALISIVFAPPDTLPSLCAVDGDVTVNAALTSTGIDDSIGTIITRAGTAAVTSMRRLIPADGVSVLAEVNGYPAILSAETASGAFSCPVRSYVFAFAMRDTNLKDEHAAVMLALLREIFLRAGAQDSKYAVNSPIAAYDTRVEPMDGASFPSTTTLKPLNTDADSDANENTVSGRKTPWQAIVAILALLAYGGVTVLRRRS